MGCELGEEKRGEDSRVGSRGDIRGGKVAEWRRQCWRAKRSNPTLTFSLLSITVPSTVSPPVGVGV